MTLILNGTDNSATTPAVTGTDTDTGVYYPAANQVALATNGTQAVLVNATQGVQFNYGISVGGTAPSTNGTGVKFPATQVSASDANTLDDYEEGTWTPVYTGGGISVTYSEQSGRYTKIGNMVYFNFRLVVTAASGGSGVLRIDGLPFLSAPTGGNPGFVAIDFSYGWTGANAILSLIPSNSSTTLDTYTQYAAYNSNTQVPVSALTAGGTIYIIAGGCYAAAS